MRIYFRLLVRRYLFNLIIKERIKRKLSLLKNKIYNKNKEKRLLKYIRNNYNYNRI